MNRTQMRLVRVLLIIFLLLLAAFLILSSDRLHPGEHHDDPVPNIEHRPSEDAPTPTPGNISSDTELTPTDVPPTAAPAKPAQLFDVTGSNPHTTQFRIVRNGSTVTTDSIAYSNYNNAVRTLYPEGAVLSFRDDGFYTYTGTDGVAHTYRISDYIDFRELFSGQSSAENGSWFFLNALETRDYVYAAYDFWSVDELTLFFRMDKTGRDVVLVYATHYDEFQNIGIFTASNEYIFYIYNTYDTETGAIESSILQAETDGSKSGILLPLPDGYSAHHLSLADNALLFLVTDPNGGTALVRMDTMTQELTYVAEHCRASDYLYLYRGYAIVGKSGASLVLYHLDSCEEVLIPLGNATFRSFGLPVCNDSRLYLQYFDWNADSDTVLLEIDIASETATPCVLQKNSLCYVTGITDTHLYAESNGGYLQFPFP